MLVLSLDRQGKLELHVNQTWFRELACWRQLGVRWAGKLEISKKNIVKTIVFLRPEVAQDGPKRAHRIILGARAVVCRPVLGPSWAHLGPSWALPGPSRGVKEGILRQILGLEGLILGCKVAKS